MKLTIMTPGDSELHEGTQKQLVTVAAADMEKRGVDPRAIHGHLFSLGRMNRGFGGTVVSDSTGNLIASYRLTR